MRTPKYREIEVQDDQGNILGVYDDVKTISEEFGIAASSIYFVMETGGEMKRKKLFFQPREVIGKRQSVETMEDEVPLYAKRFAEAKSREERLKIRSEFCEKFRNVYGFGDQWAKIAMQTINYQDILAERRALVNRKTFSRPVVQLDRRGKVIRRYPSIKAASEALFVSYCTALNYLKGTYKNPDITIAYGDEL